MNWIIKLLAALIPNLIKELIGKKAPTMDVGKSDGDTEKALKDKIDEKW